MLILIFWDLLSHILLPHIHIRDLCEKNGFSFICNDVITTNSLWKNGVHPQDMGAHILSNHFLKFLNNSVDNNFDNPL